MNKKVLKSQKKNVVRIQKNPGPIVPWLTMLFSYLLSWVVGPMLIQLAINTSQICTEDNSIIHEQTKKIESKMVDRFVNSEFDRTIGIFARKCRFDGSSGFFSIRISRPLGLGHLIS